MEKKEESSSKLTIVAVVIIIILLFAGLYMLYKENYESQDSSDNQAEGFSIIEEVKRLIQKQKNLLVLKHT